MADTKLVLNWVAVRRVAEHALDQVNKAHAGYLFGTVRFMVGRLLS